MKKKLIPLFLLSGATLLTACAQEKANTPAVAAVTKEDAVAAVNGKYISKTALTELESEITQRNRGQAIPKEKIVEELVQRELLVQDALQKKLNQTPEYAKQLETVKASLLTQATIQNFLKSHPVTDAEVKAEYDKNMVDTGKEYKARHILLKTEEDAKQVIAELSAGADFAELAKTKSTGPSGPQGGDLGWFAPGQMVPPFSEAVIALEDNKFTLEPVKTQFGYHVILREGSRAQTQTPPPFESIKEQIRPVLQRKKLQEFLAELRNKAKIEVFLPAPAPAATPETAGAKAITPTADKASAKISETAEKTKAAAADAASSAIEKAKSATGTISSKVSESAEQAKTAATDTVKNAVNRVSETVETAKENAKSAASETAKKADKAVSEKAAKTLDALTH